MSEVVSGVAHEVSQPLQAMAGLLGSLATHDLQEPSQSLLEQVNNCLEVAQEILHRTRKFLKSDTEKQRFDINDLIRETLRLVNHEWRQLRVAVELDLDDRSLFIFAERIQIQQVLLNLFRNATDALSDQEPGKRSFRVKTYFRNENVVVEVTDSGIGLSIEPELVFSPYVTTKQDGLGMGLAIVSRIIEQHEGEISVRAAETETVFTFLVPGEY